MSERVRVWCLRHGESESNAQVPGVGNDSGLTELGRHQVIAAARQLAREPVAGIYSSTAVRARQTAEILTTPATAPGAPGLPSLRITTMAELGEVGVMAEVLRSWVVEWDGHAWRCGTWPAVG